jgi:hypothetical protein
VLYLSQDSANVTAVIPAIAWFTVPLNEQTGNAYHPAITAAMELVSSRMDWYFSNIHRLTS